MTQTQQQKPVFDKADQLQKIQSGLLQGEIIIAVYDCIDAGGTEFMGITDGRVIIQSFVSKKLALTSIPYPKINAVSLISDNSSSSISISAGGREYVADFRVFQKAHHTHDAVLWHMMR